MIIMYANNHLANVLRKSSAEAGEKVFVDHHHTGEKITYDVFFTNAERIASVLVETGLQPGDRVAVQAPKTVAMLELYVGTILAGGVFLPLNTAYTAAEIEYFLGDARPRIFVCDGVNEKPLKLVAEKCGVAQVLTINTDESGSLAAARDAEAPGFQAVSRKADDLGAILYTSGTTGRSKGAMLSHGALASNAETLSGAWRFTNEDVLIHALPIFHTHGLFVATNVTMVAGGSCIFMAGFDGPAILNRMPEATSLMGVPTFYTRLLQFDGLAEAARGMRLFVSGSAPLLSETHERWREVTGHAILERYGMTETNMNTSNPYDGERRAGTVGFPLPGVEVIVTNPETGERLPTGETGVLEVRGPNVFSGYWQMPEKTAEELRENGFFITGDLGKIDRDGYVHIVGRSKDLIISGGLNVYPKEIESVIDEIDGVVESAVIGVPHSDFGEAVVAVVVREKNDVPDKAGIMAIVAEKLAKFKQPKAIIFADELPRNTMGKVQKNALRDLHHKLFG